jgi:uncharacterized membrane protein
VAGSLWLLVLGAAVDGESGIGMAALWTLPAAVTWYVLVTNAAAHPPRKPHGGVWWLLSLGGPLSLVLLAFVARGDAEPAPAPRQARAPEEHMTTDELLLRVSAVEDQMQALQAELGSIRAALGARGTATPQPAAPLRTAPAAPAVPKTPAAPPPPKTPPRELDLGALLGPKALAWAGGLVTLLGVLFFFILAVNNGWIGPSARVLFGALASAIVFGAGFWLRRRFGETDSSLAAVGAGIGGGYATLAAATVLYDLVSKPFALVVAALIAAAALAVAVAWRAELIAALGLIGAIVAPALLATQGGLTAAGVGFAALVTTAALAVGVRLRWQWLLIGAVVASAPQVVALVLEASRLDGGAITIAIVFALLYLGSGIAEQLARRDEALAPLPTMLVLGSIALTWLAAALLFGTAGGGAAGSALLVAAGAFGGAAVLLWLRSQRELGTLLGTIALAAAAVGVANLLSGANLAYTFAAEGVVLAVAARKVREPRMQLGALAYLVLAGGHALVVDAPPDSLVDAARHPASGAGALAATVVAALVVMRMSNAEWRDGGERGVLRFFAPLVAGLRAHQRELRIAAACTAALFAVDAISLVVLELAEDAWTHGGVVASFHRGHVLVTALWALGGLATTVLATRRGAQTARLLAFGWLGVTALKVAAYEGSQLTGLGFSLSFLTVASALLAAGYLGEVLETRTSLSWEGAVAVLASVLYAVVSLAPVETEAHVGLGLLAIAAVLGALAVPVFARLRNLCTLLWAPALVLAAVAVPLLVDGTWITLVWALAASALAWLSVATRERRFLAGSLAYAVLTAGAAFVHSPPWQLVVAREHPAHGIVGVLLLTGTVAVFGWAAAALDERLRTLSLWTAGVLLVHAASLGILELAERVSTASLHTDFQRGHTGVSALWGTFGLALLYVGLTRHRRALRLGGFALLGVSLGKLFLYDLSQLSSITRALSFLAVGAVLLLAGFFTQRLTAQLGDRDGPAAYS